MAVADEAHGVRLHYLESEFLQPVVHYGGKYASAAEARIGDFFFVGFSKCLEACPHWHFVCFVCVLASYIHFIHIRCLDFVLRPSLDMTIYSISRRNGPVTEAGSAASCSGVPCATIVPPFFPPSGPMSKM